MASFQAGNQKWLIELTILDVGRLKSACDVDLFDANSLSELLADSPRIYEVVWHLVSDQAAGFGVDEGGFAKIFTSHYGEVVDAFTEALSDFFQAMRRPELSSVIAKTLSAYEKLQQSAEKRIRSADQAIDRIVQQAETKADQLIDQHLQSIGVEKSGV
ncbi:MAG TPA: hypothetical protein DDW52_30450 [Planctomycetaceae bacterium]|nr:hypothetical protein [Planctomycetaceae bacterium]